MDKTVPQPAAIILDFVRETEVGTAASSGYDVIYGHNQNKLEKPITQMTIEELQAKQSSFTKRFKSSASGGYQFMKRTLAELRRELGLRGTQVFDPDLQDRLAYHLLIRRGYHQWLNGEISMEGFAKRLAMEWASFPVLAPTQGHKRDVWRGQSYYAGDGLNKALVSPEAIEALLRRVLAAAKTPTKEKVRDVERKVEKIEKPAAKSTTNWAAALLAALGSAATAFTQLDVIVQLAIIVVLVGLVFYIFSERGRKTRIAKEVLRSLKELKDG